MRNLQRELDNLGYKYTKYTLGAKSIFFPVSIKESKIKIVKFLGGKVIQRLDGIHINNRDLNHEMEKVYKEYTDFYIFQSDFSRKMAFKYFGEVPKEKYALIVNGANTEVFYPCTTQDKSSKIKLVTSGNFRSPLMVMPILDVLDSLNASGFNVELTLLGPINLDQQRQEILSKEYVIHKIIDDQGELADELRAHDIFLYTYYNAACPNSVIEAVCCGLPVVGYDSGSMKELCSFNKELLAFVSDEIVHDATKYDSDKLKEKLLLCIDQFEYFKKKSLQNASKYSMISCTEQYKAVFDRIQPEPILKSVFSRA